MDKTMYQAIICYLQFACSKESICEAKQDRKWLISAWIIEDYRMINSGVSKFELGRGWKLFETNDDNHRWLCFKVQNGTT